MSERERRHEHANSHEQHIDISKEVEASLRELEARHEASRDTDHESESDTFKHEAESIARPSEEILQENEKLHEDTEAPRHSHANHAALKQDVYRKTLQQTQSQLDPMQRRFSSFLHHPIVESTSEIAAKTVARPTGIAWGAISAAFGTILSLFFAYRYGFSYNYLLFLLLFAGGYIIGTALELGIYHIKRLRKPTS